MTYQQIRAQLTAAQDAYSDLSATDGRRSAIQAEIQRLSNLLKQVEAAVPRWHRGGGNYRPH
jgi:hypothetical protein